MNIGLISSYLGSYLVFLAAVILSFKNPLVLLDFNSAVIVVGGTMAAAFVSYSPQKIIIVCKVFMLRIMRRNTTDYQKIIVDIVSLSKAKKKSKRDYDKILQEVSHPFLAEAGEILFWAESNISPEQLQDLLVTRADSSADEYDDDAKTLKGIGKYPPAFGLMGTTIGMIALLQDLGGSNIQETIGASMAIALITTLYGLVIANVMINPVADQIVKQSKEQDIQRRMIIEGVMMIHEGLPTQFIEEKIKSFLTPKFRNAMPTGSQTKKAA